VTAVVRNINNMKRILFCVYLSIKLHSVQIYSPIILNRVADKSKTRYDYLSAIIFGIIGL